MLFGGVERFAGVVAVSVEGGGADEVDEEVFEAFCVVRMDSEEGGESEGSGVVVGDEFMNALVVVAFEAKAWEGEVRGMDLFS